MTKRSNRTKREQIRALINLYRHHPQARLTALDIAGELDCDVSTVTRYIAELRDTDEFVLKRDRENRYYVPEQSRVPLGELDLTLHERAALYLAARLLQQITDERNDHVATALAERSVPCPRLCHATRAAHPR